MRKAVKAQRRSLEDIADGDVAVSLQLRFEDVEATYYGILIRPRLQDTDYSYSAE